MESQFTFDFNPVSAIVADAVGRPGQRTFFLQACQDGDMATLIMEKEQVAALATSILQLLEELEKERADLPAVEEETGVPSLREPLEPAFRVGQLGLGYDERQDLMVVIAQAIPDAGGEEQDLAAGPPSPEMVDDEGNDQKARFYATRAQMRSLSEHALQVVAAGRPDCPLCGRVIEPDGHFCPRTNGHAFPLSV
ncbi:MAG: DUF3090 domain-containing protein [Caldilineaceae bacterium]|nr:DUF3090 domain-containing protein [Caldilineaceae bacterium]MDE0633648.1 DUF3090 domain-containing protein [Caldilineaceae bacterium]MXZ23101.1 DUF3090 domain-containing protein [Caldilineaceae bacterium SB0665_bin_25]